MDQTKFRSYPDLFLSTRLDKTKLNQATLFLSLASWPLPTGRGRQANKDSQQYNSCYNSSQAKTKAGYLLQRDRLRYVWPFRP